MFNGNRLRIARRRAKLTQRQLAKEVDQKSITVNRHESGKTEPPPDTVERYAAVLSFPVAFFYGDDIDEASENAASFRSMSTLLARERHAALAASSVAFLFGDWIEARFELPTFTGIPDLSKETSEGAARMLREMWRLGELPIRDMLGLLESKGFRVFSLAENTRNVDAFSLWRDEQPYIFLNTMKTAEHSRMDAAHELGHLVIHRHGAPAGRQAEDEANAFASEFLMPESDVRAQIPRVYSLEHMIRAKARWLVSLAALNYRVHQLKITSDWQYRGFCIQIQERGFRKSEPAGIRPETSAVWQQVLAMLRAEKLTKIDVAREIGVPAREIEKLVFGLAPMLSLEGQGSGSGSKARGDLRIV